MLQLHPKDSKHTCAWCSTDYPYAEIEEIFPFFVAENEAGRVSDDDLNLCYTQYGDEGGKLVFYFAYGVEIFDRFVPLMQRYDAMKKK